MAASALILLSPVLAALAVAVAAASGRPVLFRQARPGKDGKPFIMYKFRTMREARDALGEALPDTHRLTRFGRWLRASSLDELPELWNVFRGDMSLVGPRPLLMEYLPLYSDRQARRHHVRPGLTGWAQIHGRNETDWEERLERDVWYVENHTLALDLYILMRTLRVAFSRQGVSHAGHATMPKFTGSGGHPPS